MDSQDSVKTIEFSEWKWGERRSSDSNEPNNPHINKRCTKDRFEINNDHLISFEENLKSESTLVSEALQETRKRKFFAINASMILFPGLIGGLLAVASSIENITPEDPEFDISDYYWVALVAISMFIGMANMISIKYIAAYKAQANLFIRQLNCLRQVRDSITYYKFEGKYPIHVNALIEGSTYYRIFGKHRKLYVGNEELRDRLGGSFSDSADKSLIGFLFITSLTLISAPYICLAEISIENWSNLIGHHSSFLDNKAHLIFFNMLFVILSVVIFVWGHWENFKKLRTADLIQKAPEENSNSNSNESTEDIQNNKNAYKELFKLKISDYVSMLLVVTLAIYWIYLGLNISEDFTVFMVIMVTLSITSMFLILICIKKVFFDSLNRIHKSIVYKLDFSFHAIT